MSTRGPDRKAEIVDAAIARIVAFGLEGLRVRDVAQDVGINNATLHHHFATKSALVAAIVRRFVAQFKVDGGVPPDGTLEGRFAAYIETRREHMRRAPATFIVLNELMVLASRDEEVRQLMARMQDEWRNYLAWVCREGGDDPDTALKRADRCRLMLLGSGLDIAVSRRDD